MDIRREAHGIHIQVTNSRDKALYQEAGGYRSVSGFWGNQESSMVEDGSSGAGRRLETMQSCSVFCILIPTFLLPSKELLEILHGERFLAT